MTYQNSPLYRILNPKSICVMGASNKLYRMGTVALLNIVGTGFKGPTYIVHPNDVRIQNFQVWADFHDLPETPDLLVLAIPTRVVPHVLERAGQRGIKHAVIITAGYNEIGHEGKQLQKSIDDIVSRYDMHYIGPNCIGFVNTRLSINTTPFPFEGRNGGIGFASHSGSYVCHVFSLLEDLDMGIAEMISMGNEANLDVVDALNYFGGHPQVKVVGLYLEGIRRPEEFRMAARALAREKPVVALYAGNTAEGARSAASHTAAVSTSGKLMKGFLKQCGIIQAHTVNELYNWLNAFERLPLPRGRRVAVLSNSGGPATSTADHIGQSDLELAKFSPQELDSLQKLMPHTGSCQNPIDLTFSSDLSIFSEKLPRLLSQSRENDAILLYGLFGADLFNRVVERAKNRDPKRREWRTAQMEESVAEAMANSLKNCAKPVLGSSFNIRGDKSIRKLMRNGNIPFYDGPEQAVQAVEAMWRYSRIREWLRHKKMEV